MLEITEISQYVWLFVGLCVGLIIDIYWWINPSFKKLEKGLESFEHYHISFCFFIVFIIVGILTKHEISMLFFGLSVAFFIAEWTQSKEVKGKKVVPGHPFAYGSIHFKQSSVIGIILIVVAISLYAYLPTILS